MGVMGELLLQAGLLPALGVAAAVVMACASAGVPLRRRLQKLGDRLLACLLLLVVLLVLAAAGHCLGWDSHHGDCQPSPNGRICEDE